MQNRVKDRSWLDNPVRLEKTDHSRRTKKLLLRLVTFFQLYFFSINRKSFTINIVFLHENNGTVKISGLINKILSTVQLETNKQNKL
jgi:hypothetical protein